MTPAQVYEMDDDEYRVFQQYMSDELRERERAAKRKR